MENVPSKFERVTPCCKRKWNAQDDILDGEDGKGPIFWNEFNKAVQCHMCGDTFDVRHPSPE